ncbi:MAG: NYN domain-containing protein [Acidimicrobiia bacterium]
MADHFVIDGSNLATEGRTEPSLAQLWEAVAAFRAEHPDAMVTVVVDASFEHRIDPSERPAFAKAESASEVVSPPAGAVGRGDGFLLQIANRTDATVVSNDSFQEFHAEYEWLFEPGRLIGGKPVPSVGWIFSLRRPVRGIVSRKTTQRAKREDRAAEQVREAIAEATADAMTNQAGGRRRRRGSRGTPRPETVEPEAVNQPAPFLQFIIDHRLGTPVEGVVDAFSSHGAFVIVGEVRCYVPLSAMGDPRPTRARDVLNRGETRTFVVQAVDAPRRGIELALPGFEKVAGAPSDETVQAEVKKSRPRKVAATTAKRSAAARNGAGRRPAKTAAARTDGTKPAAEKTTPKKTAAKAKQATTKKAAAAKQVAPKKAAPAKKAAAKRTTAKKAAAPAKKATTKKAAAAKAAPTPKKASTPAKKTAGTAKKAAAPAKKATAKKAAATTRSATKRGRR